MEYKFDQITKLTGLKQATIRNWEKRFNFPLSKRTESGQRVFDEAQLHLLLRISKALKLGQKPSSLFFQLAREESNRENLRHNGLSELGPYKIIHHIESQDVSSYREVHRDLRALETSLLRQQNLKLISQLQKIFMRYEPFSKVTRICLSVRHGLSNEIRVLESSNMESLFENQMPAGYRCFLSQNSSLLSLDPEDIRYCKNIHQIKKQFEKEKSPTQRSLALLIRSGFCESLAIPLHGPFDSPLGFLFLNSSEDGCLEKMVTEYKSELALLRQIGSLAIQDCIQATTYAINKSTSPQKPEDYWAVPFNHSSLQKLIKLLPVRLNKIQLEPSMHYLASAQNEVALFSLGNFATAFSHAVDSLGFIEVEQLSVSLRYENSKIYLLFKGIQQVVHPSVRQNLERLFTAFGFAVNWGNATLEILTLAEPIANPKSFYTSL